MATEAPWTETASLGPGQLVIRVALRILCWLPWQLGARLLRSPRWSEVWRSRPVPACYTPGAIQWEYRVGCVRHSPAILWWWLKSTPRRSIIRQMLALLSAQFLLGMAAWSLLGAGQPLLALLVSSLWLFAILGGSIFSFWAGWYQGCFIRGEFGRMFHPILSSLKPATRAPGGPDVYRREDLRWWRQANSQAWSYVGLWCALGLPIALALLYWSSNAVALASSSSPIALYQGHSTQLSDWVWFCLNNVLLKPVYSAGAYGTHNTAICVDSTTAHALVVFGRGLVSLFLVQALVAIFRRRVLLGNTVNELNLYPARKEQELGLLPSARLIRLGHWLFAPMAGQAMTRPAADADLTDDEREEWVARRMQALKILDALVDDRFPGIAEEVVAIDPDDRMVLLSLKLLLEDADRAQSLQFIDKLLGRTRTPEQLEQIGWLFLDLDEMVKTGPAGKHLAKNLSEKLSTSKTRQDDR